MRNSRTTKPGHSADPGCSRGFTLLEVLVALAIVAVALAAVIRAVGETAGSVVHLRDKAFATWVAENRIAEMRLQSPWPTIARSNGTEEMGGTLWRWTQEVAATEDPDLRRVEVSVGRESIDDDSLVTMTAFRGRRQ